MNSLKLQCTDGIIYLCRTYVISCNLNEHFNTLYLGTKGFDEIAKCFNYRDIIVKSDCYSTKNYAITPGKELIEWLFQFSDSMWQANIQQQSKGIRAPLDHEAFQPKSRAVN
jgi:hypothetical protein